MNKILIESYIKQIRKDDIAQFVNKNGISLSSKDIDILFHYVKDRWHDLLYGNKADVFKFLSDELDDDKVSELEKLYKFYYTKYQGFL